MEVSFSLHPVQKVSWDASESQDIEEAPKFSASACEARAVMEGV